MTSLNDFPHDELYASLDKLKHFSPRENEGDFAVMNLVWAKIKSHQWWSGDIFKEAASEPALKHKKDCRLLAYFGDKGFALSVSQLLNTYQNSSKTFINAVDYTLKEVSSRVQLGSNQVQLGLACTCVSGEIWDKLRLENSEVPLKSSERHGDYKPISFNLFKPDKAKYDKLLEMFPFSQVDIETTKSTSLNSFATDELNEYLNLLSNFVFSEFDKIDITIAKAQLSNFCHNWFEICGVKKEEDSVVIEDGSQKRKAVD
ncbi:putative PWWP domain-containing protein [Tanacetum coccineum]